MNISDAQTHISTVLDRLGDIILGKEVVLRQAVCCLLARGHLLIEDIPGVGKTTLSHGLASLLGLDFNRIQCTSDMLPADIIGANVYNRQTESFVFHSGPVFTHLLLADEINRASPKTQSALLEAMEEQQVSIDGETHVLPQPFFVMATQNPLEQVGTFMLPESQLDRFLMRLHLGHPERAAERQMLKEPDRKSLLADMSAITNAAVLQAMQAHVADVFVSDPIYEYMLDLLTASRQVAAPGLSPRAGLGVKRAAQAWAFIDGRSAVLPEDVQAIAHAVMAHRLRGRSTRDGSLIVDEMLSSVAVR